MLVVRCTRELLDRLGTPPSEAASTTTALGDWFAKPVVVGRAKWILLMSSASRLPLVVPGDGGSLRRDLPESLDLLLSGLDVPRDLIHREMTATGDIVFAATNDASVVASLNDFASRLKRYLPEWSLTDPIEVSLRLGSVPLKVLGYELPADAARKLLA